MRTCYVAAGAHTLAPVTGRAARCVVVDGDRIVWVGPDPDEAPPADTTVDLGDAWMTPAFVDAHVHATATGLLLDGVDLDACADRDAVLDRVRRAAADQPTGTALLGARWEDTAWPDPRPPTARELTLAAPDRPVLLTRVDGHSCLVDDVTLSRLPLDRMEGVVRDDDGAPTGWLAEQASEAAQRLVRDALPTAQLDSARRAACARAAELGIASLHEMGHPGLSSLADARTWAGGEWPVEVLVWWAELDAESGPAHGLRPGGDLFLDGSVGTRTAAVSCGYGDGTRGQLFHTDQAVAAFFTACTSAGRGAGVHAIGDDAVEQAVAGIETAAERCGVAAVRACRHRVEHVEVVRAGHVGRLARLGVVASVQPAFDAVWGGEGGLYAARFGPDVARAMNPFGPLEQAGVTLAFGSDSTVTPLDPWGAVAAAVAHQGGLGIDAQAGLAAHVLGGRHVAGQDDVGRLLRGQRADVAIWARDPLPEGSPEGAECLETLVAGRRAHQGG